MKKLILSFLILSLFSVHVLPALAAPSIKPEPTPIPVEAEPIDTTSAVLGGFDLGTLTLDQLQALKTEVETVIKEKTPVPAAGEIISETSRQNPALIGTTVLFPGARYYNPAECELTIDKVIRGPSAYEIIQRFNRYNEKPEKGTEYIITYVKTKVVESEYNEKGEFDDHYFTYVSAKGVEYASAWILDAKPVFTDLYPGAENTGIVIAKISTDDKPLLVYLKDAESPVWFDLNKKAK